MIQCIAQRRISLLRNLRTFKYANFKQQTCSAVRGCRALCIGLHVAKSSDESSLHSGLGRFHTVKGGERETVKSDSDRTV